ncbi:tRNA pseudouridine(55) synthase TruB [Clostridium sp. AF19-22AC]|jgi:tRNA pseudouridine55 synthase|uniref:tRNA pseudouridine(55) synthase TruB n=1 Tax=Clostridia TaxID=186801 RepID=UPI000E494F63|nr:MULTISPECIES: tRNA pseudouridine(55) synthase TruB [Clostridia]RHR32385.1 tRNA pseudouridine(55) synthase TruB [Clostridium sp. AF19-22AC]
MINGVINVYKEKGFTSHDVVAKLRGILGQKKIGHTGTLDPDAEGVLPVCLGKATKLCDMLTDKDKIYETVLLLGKTTDTQDITGKVLEETDTGMLAAGKIEDCIKRYIGEYEQIPPMYSALKVNGKKLYELAREGKEIERKPRRVQIHDIRIQKTEIPRVWMEVSCSKGTYIRTLCHDIGQDLGTGACMESLLRTKVSRFELKDSLKLAQIEEMKKGGCLMEAVTPVDQMFSELGALTVLEEHAALAYNGNPVPEHFLENPGSGILEGTDGREDTRRFRMYDEAGQFIGIYSFCQNSKEYRLEKMFLDQEELRG